MQKTVMTSLTAVSMSDVMSLSVNKFFARLRNKYKLQKKNTGITPLSTLPPWLLTYCPTSMELGLERCHQGHHPINPGAVVEGCNM